MPRHAERPALIELANLLVCLGLGRHAEWKASHEHPRKLKWQCHGRVADTNTCQFDVFELCSSPFRTITMMSDTNIVPLLAIYNLTKAAERTRCIASMTRCTWALQKSSDLKG